jgi:hypothetical protein
MLLLKECLLLLFILLSTQSRNFWIHPHIGYQHPELKNEGSFLSWDMSGKFLIAGNSEHDFTA